MARFLKASKQAKKLAAEGTAAEQRDFFKKVGSNPKLVARQVVFSPRGPWQHVESTLLIPAPASDFAEAGGITENTFPFSQSGQGGIERLLYRPHPRIDGF
ncbi:MAG: hypothetical protein IT445_18830 [Phycisphaeraceae bacterium]|nr:hypothetical protein [Phycisphaeraceae bacterium]